MMRSPRIQQRTRYFALAFLLAAVVVALGGTSFQRKVASFQSLGFEARSESAGSWRVLSVDRPETGLREGDWIFGLFDLESLRGQPSTELRVIRGGEPTDRPLTYERPALEIDAPYLILALVGLVYLLIGLYTALKDRHLHGRLFSLWCLSSAALYILSAPEPGSQWVGRAIFTVDHLARLLLPPLTLHLFLVFPAGGARPRVRRAIPFLYLPAALLAALHADMALTGGRLFAGGPMTEARGLFFDQLELALLVLFSLTAAVALGVRTSRRRGDERWQLFWIVAGMVGAYASLLLLHLLPRFLELGVPDLLATAAALPLGLVPLLFAYFILRHKLLDLGIILRDSITLSLTVLVGIFGFSLIDLLIDRLLPAGQPLAKSLLTFVAGVAIAGVLVPTRSALASGFERLQYRGALGKRRALIELGQEILHERDLRRLLETLLEGQKAGLGVARTAMYLRDGDRLVPVRDDARLPPHLDFGVFGEDFWASEAIGLSALELPDVDLSAEQRLFRGGFRYAFPLAIERRGGGRQRIGIFLTSYKEGGEALNSEDIDLARGLLNQAALAIENAQLLSDVQRQLAEVGRLREHNRGIIEASPAGIAVLDAAGRVVTANQAFAAIAGLERTGAAVGPLEELLPIHPLPTPAEGMVDVSFCELDGHERYLQVSTAHYRQDAESLRVLVVHDVSERMAIESALREKERLASLGMLAAGVAHEVNTPLTGISSYAQLLLADTDESDPRFEILKKMEQQTFRAAQIVNNLLDFARNRNDTVTPVELARVVGDSADSLAERAAEQGVRIERRLVPGTGRVLGNEQELHQVFSNLILNAIDAMAGHGGGRLLLAADSAGHRLRVRVSDEGTGIPPERLERIFQPFFSSKLGKGGTGLGLAITYNIVRRHGGEIRVRNHADSRGCTFTVELPRHDDTAGNEPSRDVH